MNIPTIDGEIWSLIDNKNSFISNFGRSWSLFSNNHKKERIIKGYKAVSIHRKQVSKNNKRFVFIHRAVALAFVPNPLNKPQVNHLDGNRLNNHYSNLEWCTQEENFAHAKEIGLIKPKLTTITIEQIKILTMLGANPKELAKLYSVTDTTIRNVVQNKTWTQLNNLSP